jgi:uncharacterized membrane protein HdeD (DUF308 family)
MHVPSDRLGHLAPKTDPGRLRLACRIRTDNIVSFVNASFKSKILGNPSDNPKSIKREGDLMSASSNFGSDLTHQVKSNAGWGIVIGILTAVLGLLLIAYPFFAAKATTILIAWILIIAGVFEIVQAVRAQTVGAFFSRLLLGVVYGFGGVVLRLNPLRGVAVLSLVLGVMLLAEAVVTAVLAFQAKPASGWGWFLFDAVITAILGFLILAHWPASSVWAIGTLVGVAVLVRGITRIAFSVGLRRVTKRVEEINARPPRAA